ncbi:MAG TPA: NAD-dependent epimerase/dehydratase family protein [Pyrinomonadaceae bacterium]|jgi:dihydroflavonol-4-reductase|nr:NAD-dependent epimerase/dehydratase family protein [Pyrinomonadaceae bacterium]
MPSKTPGKRTARMTPVPTGTKRRAAIEKRQRAVTLITGGTGFLGSHLVRQLTEDGAKDVRVMATSIPDWLVDLGVETFAGSITNADDNKRAVEGISEIYHLAGKVSREREDARAMYDIHVEGTRLLCDAAKAAGVKTVVLASTSGTIAVSKDGEVIPDETYPIPLDIISRWPYYASKAYQEMAALERFQGKGLRLVIMNPSLLLGPGDDRLSSTKLILDFMARKIGAVPTGGVSFVDARDAARTFRVAMKKGRHGERYLLGAANWTFSKFFGRLERLTKVSAPWIALPSRLAITGASLLDSLFKQWDMASPVEPGAIEMAQYFWYLNCSKAARELSFKPRDPGETLQDTVAYVRENFLGSNAFGK